MRRGWTKKKKKCGVVTEGERKCVRVCIEGERMYVFARVYEGQESVLYGKIRWVREAVGLFGAEDVSLRSDE